jgi:hypothetical protein
MARHLSTSPPPAAIRLLTSGLPALERDEVLGDLFEVFENRADAGRHFNRCWFWAQTVLFLGLGVLQRSTRYSPGRFFMGFGHSLRQSARRLRQRAPL